MLAIRLQRQGRKGYPVYRIIIQEAHRTPSSGRVVACVGHYNPHTKENKLDIEKIEEYLSHGAQPTPRVVRLLIDNKIKLPDWVEKPATTKTKKTRFADKLRKNQPKEEVSPEETTDEVAEELVEESTEEISETSVKEQSAKEV